MVCDLSHCVELLSHGLVLITNTEKENLIKKYCFIVIALPTQRDVKPENIFAFLYLQESRSVRALNCMSRMPMRECV